MTQRIPQTQDAPPFTGTFVIWDDDGLLLGSATQLYAGPWMNFSISGTTGFISDAAGHAPLGWGGRLTQAGNYVRNSVWRIITGCYADIYVEAPRDLLIMANCWWSWYNIGRMQMYFRLTYNGVYTRTTTGMYPGTWQDTDTNFPGSYDVRDDSMLFIFRARQKGAYRIQLEWYNNNQNVDQSLVQAYIAVM